MIATHLIRSVAVTVAKYRATQRLERGIRPVSKMCLVLEEAEASGAWRERMERRRLCAPARTGSASYPGR